MPVKHKYDGSSPSFGRESVRGIITSLNLVRWRLAVTLRPRPRDSDVWGTGIATGTVWSVVKETGVITMQRWEEVTISWVLSCYPLPWFPKHCTISTGNHGNKTKLSSIQFYTATLEDVIDSTLTFTALLWLLHFNTKNFFFVF